MDIYIDRAGTQYGPFQQPDVERMLTDGDLLESDLAWCETLDGWVPLSSLISRSEHTESASAVMPDSVAAPLGAAVVLAAIHAHHTEAPPVEAQPTNVAPVDPDYVGSDLPTEDYAMPPPLPAEPHQLPPAALQHAILELDAPHSTSDDMLLGAEVSEPEITPDFDLDFDFDFDFDFDLPDVDIGL